jgi:Asp-tRNA(Asn)/Glu-tRNA(Gln) amidotransferase A subunit family amidase
MARPSGPLTRLSALELARLIRTGATSAVEVVEAHIAVLERIADRNALAADRFAAARDEAAKADTRVAAGEPDLPPLLGVPATVKELIAVEGMPHTGGFPHRRRFRERADAPAVARLRAAGAIVLGVGNTPGPYYWLETNNKIYGRTSNAYDPRRTSGGSSGGDSVIVASGGAPIALGSDMGGSIRVPAFFNGIFGHLPSPGLVPITGHFPMPSGEVRRTLFLGPLARRAEDLAPVLRVIAGPDGHDPNVRTMTLGDPAAVALPGLRVLVSTESSTLPLRRVLKDALDRAATALGDSGAVVEEVTLRGMRWALAQFGAVASSELDLLASWSALMAPTTPRAGRTPLLIAAPARVLQVAEAAPVRALRGRAARRLVDAARRASDELSAAIGDGVLLYPPFPRIAPRHRTTLGQPWLATNTAVFNLFGLPVTQVPLGLGAAGLPLGVQVVAAPGHDHVSIAVALDLERSTGGWVDPHDGEGSSHE